MPTKDFFKPITGSNSDTITVKDARWFSGVLALGAVAATSIFTRYRVSNGQQPILKVFF